MAKLISGGMELNEWNDAAVAPTLYFDKRPTDAEVKAACDKLAEEDKIIETFDDFEWEEHANNLSKRAKTIRIQVYER